MAEDIIEVEQMLSNIKIFYPLLVIVGILNMPISGLVNFTLPKADIVHTKSGLILHYLSEYRPADQIVTFTVTIPMVPDMCCLIPRGAMKKIPHCHPKAPIMQKFAREQSTLQIDRIPTSRRPTATLTRPPTISQAKPVRTSLKVRLRTKRLLAEVISIGTGIAATVMSTINIIQTINSKNEVKRMQDYLQIIGQTTQNSQAQILHLNEGQLKIAHELNHTQVALNKTIAMVNEHSYILRNHEHALRTIISQTMFLSTRLASVVHAVETHFIHTSIEDILSNRLNLLFVHQQDLTRVVDLISQAVNISLEEADNSIPMVELITRLLVRQQIDFVPRTTLELTEDGPLIGKLVFTSFFAATSPDQASFSIYELVPVPFNQGKRRVRLAQMPAYLGIEPRSQQFIRWSKEEAAAACDFIQMPSCGETPARRKETQDDCLYQILTGSKLNDCRTKLYAEAIFVRRVEQHWAVSTIKANKCHSVTTSNLDEHLLHDNEEITLLSVALITTMNTNSLACDRFFLPGLPIKIGAPIHLLYNKTVNPMKKDLLDLQDALASETHWAKLPYISSDMQAMIEFITSTLKPATIGYFHRWRDHPASFTTIVLMVTIIVLGIVLIYYIHMKKIVGTKITIAIPSMKAEIYEQ